MFSAPSVFALPFIKKIQHNADTYSLYFDRSAHLFTFLPGQYVRMTLPHEHADERGTARFFTIASSPLDQKHLVITTKMLQSTFKNSMLQIQFGQLVQFWGPMGLFTLDETDARPLVLLGGGIGMTPFHSMIAYSFEKNIQRSITLIVSFSSYEDFVYYKELKHIADNKKDISVVYTVTKLEQSKKRWTGETGRISEEVLKKYVHEIPQSVYYICGPRAMVEETEALVTSLGVAEDHIHIEKFTGYQHI